MIAEIFTMVDPEIIGVCRSEEIANCCALISIPSTNNDIVGKAYAKPIAINLPNVGRYRPTENLLDLPRSGDTLLFLRYGCSLRWNERLHKCSIWYLR